MEDANSHCRWNSIFTLSALWLLFCAVIPIATARKIAAAQSSGEPRLTYTRVLKGSEPEYIAITVGRDGDATYDGRKIDDPPRPRDFRISPATVEKLFALAAQLNNFQNVDLESHKNVANLGEKTFTYQSGGQTYSAKFNYSLLRQARDLADLFEKISTVEEHLEILQYAIKYDHLSLPNELLRIQIALRNDAIVEPELLVPILKEIEGNPRFLHLAKVRAQNILAQVQSAN